MKEIIIKVDNLFWTYEVTPERHDAKEWIIRSKDYGFYKKNDAEIICEFLRKNLANIIYDSKQ